jgi:precorrin-4 methylase
VCTNSDRQYYIYLQCNFFLTKIQLADIVYQVRLNTAPCVCENHKITLLRNHMQTIIIQLASSVIGGAGYVRHLFSCTVKHKNPVHVIMKQQLRINRCIRARLYKSNTKEIQSISLLNTMKNVFSFNHTPTLPILLLLTARYTLDV